MMLQLEANRNLRAHSNMLLALVKTSKFLANKAGHSKIQHLLQTSQSELKYSSSHLMRKTSRFGLKYMLKSQKKSRKCPKGKAGHMRRRCSRRSFLVAQANKQQHFR